MEQAEIVLWLIDSTNAITHLETLAERVLPACENKQLTLVFNKTDLITAEQQELLKQKATDLLDGINGSYIFISAKAHQNTNELEKLLIDAAHLPTVTQNDVIVTNIRHHEALTHALDAIHRVQQGLNMNISGDFLSQDIRECIHYLSDIAGNVTNDQVLANIFKNFCIGK